MRTERVVDKGKMEMEEVFDLVVEGGQVVDFEGVLDCDAFPVKNLGIKEGKIKKISTNPLKGLAHIDATGKIVAPGFIDFDSHVCGNPYSGECLVKQGGTTTLGGLRHINGTVVKDIEENGFVINQGYFISHSFSLREAAGITNIYKSANKSQIQMMSDLAARFLEYGAFGIFFGLEFVPGTSLDEMIALSRVAKQYDKAAVFHIRKDGLEGVNYLEEIYHTGRQSGAKIHLVQLSNNIGVGETVMKKGLESIDAAIETGLDITADSGVYEAFSACLGTSIFDPGWEKGYENCSVTDLLITSGPYMGKYCTKELCQHLRKEYPETLVNAFVGNDNSISMPMKKNYVYISTNAADGPHYPGMGAPEVSGAFPRFIGRYVREKQVLGLRDALAKITVLPARRFGIPNKGELKEGKDGDLVIFEYEKIIDTAKYMGQGSPDTAPEGINYVIVNGEIIVTNGVLTGNRKAGKLVKSVPK